VLAAPTAVVQPGLKDQLSQVLAAREAHPLPVRVRVRVPLPADPLLRRTWEHGWWSYERPTPAPALRRRLVWDNLAGHLTSDLVRWRLHPGFSTRASCRCTRPCRAPGSPWRMAESRQRLLHPRARAGQPPQTAHQLIDWLEQTVAGGNAHPTPFVWDGQRRHRRERARLRRHALGGSGAATANGYSITT
jgi:hypothetical protein